MNPDNVSTDIRHRFAFKAPVQKSLRIGRNCCQGGLKFVGYIGNEFFSLFFFAFLFCYILNNDNPARFMIWRKLRLCKTQANRSFVDIHNSRYIRCLKNQRCLNSVIASDLRKKSLQSRRNFFHLKDGIGRRIYGNKFSVTAVSNNTHLQFT